ncbi:MAG TPA: hypothetical protein PKE63_07685 [Lacibacter sp.]|nr:hypothetical protein [Lacibacter sp.]HMO90255.1 hypothetical protein [Lacibacter sp.]HMP87145.1 hypothetical protein [Lacibacter sp.]
MKVYLFTNRIAFLLNAAFLLIVVLRFVSYELPQGLNATLLVAGLILSPLLNFLVNGWLLVRTVRREPPVAPLLAVTNLLLFIVQLFYFFY